MNNKLREAAEAVRDASSTLESVHASEWLAEKSEEILALLDERDMLRADLFAARRDLVAIGGEAHQHGIREGLERAAKVADRRALSNK